VRNHSFFFLLLFVILCWVLSSQASVTVSSPSNGAVVGSPVHYEATATTSTCGSGVASMGVYVDDSLKYVSQGASLNTSLSLGPGTYNTVVEEWDRCGGATYTPVKVTVNAQSGVWVSSPGNDTTVGSPVTYRATATSSCSKGVASMGIYINNALSYVSQGASLSTALSFSPGTYNTVVEEWDYCGGAAYTPVKIAVSGSSGSGGGGHTLGSLQASGGWAGYGEYPPSYDICSSCGSGVTWSMYQHVGSPSLSGNATQFNIGGSTPYSDVLWTNHLIGQGSTQDLPDDDHSLVPSVHNFIYDAYFYSGDLSLSQVLEFDISMYFDGVKLIFGHQCLIAGGHQWEVWDNPDGKWVPTGIACNPVSNGWNHVTLQVQRESDNWIDFQSITLNGVKTDLNWYFAPASAPSDWWGITVNYQQDGNYRQSPYSAYVDDFSLTYW
jgi:hypothetical protein